MDSFRSPTSDYIATNDMHWREMELAGFTSHAEWAKNSFRHLLACVLSGTAIISAVSIYRMRNDRSGVVLVESDRDAFGKIYRYFTYLLGGSFLLFALAPIQRFTFPLLNRLVIRKNQVGILSPFVDSNLWRVLASLGFTTYFFHAYKNAMFSVGWFLKCYTMNITLEMAEYYRVHAG